jgi:hypothetical protein
MLGGESLAPCHTRKWVSAGIKPLALAGSLFAWLIFGGGAINAAMTALLG